MAYLRLNVWAPTSRSATKLHMIVYTAALLTGDLFPGDGPVRIRVRAPTGSLTFKTEFELSDLSDRISLKEVSPTEIVLQAAPAKVNLGLKGNLTVNTPAGSPPSAGTQPPPANRRRPPRCAAGHPVCNRAATTARSKSKMASSPASQRARPSNLIGRVNTSPKTADANPDAGWWRPKSCRQFADSKRFGMRMYVPYLPKHGCDAKPL